MNYKKSILFILPNLEGGGAERVVSIILNNLSINKYEIHLVLICDKGKYKDDIPEYVSVHVLNFKKLRYSFIGLNKIINKVRPDIVFTTLMHVNIALLVIKIFHKNYKLIIREANYLSIAFPKLNLLKRIFFNYIVKIFYPYSDCIVAQCEEMKNDLVKNFRISPNIVKVIYNPIDVSYINRMSKLGGSPFNSSKVNLLAVGRLTYQKGFDNLIRSLNVVKVHIPNIHLTILGEGQDFEYLNYLVNSLELNSYVTFLGFQNNPFVFYKNCDIYVLSSRYEGFPNTLLEALACGCKVVSTDCKSGPKEILGDSEYGTLVKVDDVLSLADGIVEAFYSNNKSADRYLFYDAKNIIKQYEELFS